MQQNDLYTLLKSAVLNKRNILVVSGPGCGKTHIAVKAMQDAGVKAVVMYPSIGDPTDAKGFPWIVDGKAEFIPFGDLALVYDCIAKSIPMALFLDDLGQGAQATQASYMSLMDKLRGKCSVIAATNRRTDRAGVSGLLEPVKSRFHSIVHLEPSLNDFSNHLIDQGQALYGLDESAVVDIVSYLRFRPDNLFKFEPSNDLVNYPCPRTWVAAGQQLMLRLPTTIEFVALAGAIGEGVGGEFVSYRKMRHALPSLDNLLKNPDSVAIDPNPSIQCAVCTGLAAKATKENFVSIARYCERLNEAGLGHMAALLLQDCTRRNAELMNTMEFQKLVTGPIGDLFLGIVH